MANELYAVSGETLTQLADAVRSSQGSDYRYSIPQLTSAIGELSSHITLIGSATGRASTSGTFGEIELPVPVREPACFVCIPTDVLSDNNPLIFAYITYLDGYAGSDVKMGYVMAGATGMNYARLPLANLTGNGTVIFVGSGVFRFRNGQTYNIFRIQ